MAATACLRGVPPRTVKVRVISSEQYVAESTQQFAASTVERFERRSQALAVIGLERRTTLTDAVTAYVGRVGAYYDPRTDAVTLFDLGQGAHVESLVHEFSHALQYTALDGALDDEAMPDARAVTLDSALSRSAMFEGDVTLTTDRAAMLMFGANPDDPNWPSVYAKWLEFQLDAYKFEALPVTLADRYFVYAFGAAFLEPVRAERGTIGLEAWLRDPPHSSRAVMAGADRARKVDRAARQSYDPSAWQSSAVDASVADASVADASAVDASAVDASAVDASAVDASAVDASAVDAAADPGREYVPQPFTSGTPILAPALPGFELVTLDSLGAFVFDRFAHTLTPASRAARNSIGRVMESAAHLEADHLSLWYDPKTENAVAVYRLHFDDPAVRDAWTQLEPPVYAVGYLRMAIVDDDVVLVASADRQWLNALDLYKLSWAAFDATTLPTELRAAPNFGPGQRMQPRGVRPAF